MSQNLGCCLWVGRLSLLARSKEFSFWASILLRRKLAGWHLLCGHWEAGNLWDIPVKQWCVLKIQNGPGKDLAGQGGRGSSVPSVHVNLPFTTPLSISLLCLPSCFPLPGPLLSLANWIMFYNSLTISNLISKMRFYRENELAELGNDSLFL